MVKDIITDEKTFKKPFLDYYFSESMQWEIFIKYSYTEARNELINQNFQDHFYLWITELKHLESTKIEEETAINLNNKHFPISIQEDVQTIKNKTFNNV